MKKTVVLLFALTGCLFTTERNGGIEDGYYRQGDTLQVYRDVSIIEFKGVNYRSFHCRMREYIRYLDVNGILVGIPDTAKYVYVSIGTYEKKKDGVLYFHQKGFGADTLYQKTEINLDELSIPAGPSVYEIRRVCGVGDLESELRLARMFDYNSDDPFYMVVEYLKYPAGLFSGSLFTGTFKRVGTDGLSI